MNETLQTIKARRSVRAYTEQQVSAEDLNLILEAATYAPNGMHLETWHFTAIQNKEVLEELKHCVELNKRRFIDREFHSLEILRMMEQTVARTSGAKC